MIDTDPNDSRRGLYRAYTLNTAGRIILVEIITAADDAEACAGARAIAQHCTIELWDRARFLGRFASGQTPATPVGELAA